MRSYIPGRTGEAAARPSRWSVPTRALHWMVAAAVAFQLITGRLSDAISDRAASWALVNMHYQVGMLVAGLVIARIGARLWRPAPSASIAEPTWRGKAALGVHRGLYVLLVVLSISGFVIWDYFDAEVSILGLVTAPDLLTPTDDERLRASAWYAHAVAGWTIFALIVVHICGALCRPAFERRALLHRMSL